MFKLGCPQLTLVEKDFSFGLITHLPLTNVDGVTYTIREVCKLWDHVNTYYTIVSLDVMHLLPG